MTLPSAVIRYCPLQESKGPKAVIPIKHLNASFQPEKIGRAHGLQLTYLKDKTKVTRNLFVYHESAEVRPCATFKCKEI